MIAALYVATNGVYFDLPGVDPWDVRRDARLYPGPHPVVAHPPCERWGRYWSGGPMLARTPRAKQLGDDGGCFAAALAAVRKWGGVLEHPEASHAWRYFDLATPPKDGGWCFADHLGGWTCCVEQGHYGHRARKATWLYFAGLRPPSLRWGSSGTRMRMDLEFHSREERARAVRQGAVGRLGRLERLATPIPFRDLLLDLARDTQTLVERSATR